MDIRSVFDDNGVCIGSVDFVSGTKITLDSDGNVTLTAGTAKKMTKRQAHTLFYCFMLVSGWDKVNERTK